MIKSKTAREYAHEIEICCGPISMHCSGKAEDQDSKLHGDVCNQITSKFQQCLEEHQVCSEK